MERNNNNGGGNYNGGGNSTYTKVRQFPAWSNPDAYCYTCVYKLRKGHSSANCPKANETPGHKKEATCTNPMGGSMKCAGWGNKHDGNEQK